MRAHIDFETFSECDLRRSGSHVYATHPTTEVLCLAYCFGDEPVKLWIPGEEFPERLNDHVRSGGTVIGHNISGFELPVWNSLMTLVYGCPELRIEQCEDTMAEAYALSLPGSLDSASAAVGIKDGKDLKGHRVMLQLCKPRNASPRERYTKKEFPEKYEMLYAYCKKDVEVERELHKRLFRLSESEKKIWHLDYLINSRGVYIDPLVDNTLELVEKYKDVLNLKMREVTNGEVATATAVSQLTQWLRYRGVETETVNKVDVSEMLAREDLPEDCKKALELRQEASKSSTAKLKAMVVGRGYDGRVRGLFQYHGASTGRWSGRRVQLQNLPRPNLDSDEIETAFNILKSNDSVSQLEQTFGSVMSPISSCIRGFLRAEPGKEFFCCDFSAIEARVLAWLADEHKVLNVFRGDGKIYEHAASDIYNVPVDKVNSDQRQLGKVAVLALGYQGGVGAFQMMAKAYSVDISDSEAEVIKQKWREANPNIQSYWYSLEDAAMRSTRNPGVKYKAGRGNAQVQFMAKGSFLFCRLPSGRVISYAYPRVENFDTPWGDIKEGLTYMGVNSYTNKWERIKTYGGKLCENVTQATARCILSDSMIRLEDRGYPIVMHVHDECVIEIKKGGASLHDVERIMSEVPTWAEGLPMDAEGWQGVRYRK